MTCDHVKSKVFALKTFSNNTQHICVQCLKCGSTVKHNGKTWLKPEDVPHGKTIRPFDEELHMKGLLAQ